MTKTPIDNSSVEQLARAFVKANPRRAGESAVAYAKRLMQPLQLATNQVAKCEAGEPRAGHGRSGWLGVVTI